MEALSARVSTFVGRDDSTTAPVTISAQFGNYKLEEGDFEGPSILKDIRQVKAYLLKSLESKSVQEFNLSPSIEEAVVKLQPLLCAALPASPPVSHAASLFAIANDDAAGSAPELCDCGWLNGGVGLCYIGT